MPVQEPGTLEPEMLEPPVRAPEVTQVPQNLITDEGEPVTFTCRITGSPGNLIIEQQKLVKRNKTESVSLLNICIPY